MLPSSFFKTIHCNQFLIPNKMKRSHLKVGEKDWGKFLKGWNFAWKISNHLIKSHFGEIVISGYGKIDGHCLHYHASTCWKWWIIFHVSTIHLKNGSKWRKNATFAKHFLLWDTRLPACFFLVGRKSDHERGASKKISNSIMIPLSRIKCSRCRYISFCLTKQIESITSWLRPIKEFKVSDFWPRRRYSASGVKVTLWSAWKSRVRLDERDLINE